MLIPAGLIGFDFLNFQAPRGCFELVRVLKGRVIKSSEGWVSNKLSYRFAFAYIMP